MKINRTIGALFLAGLIFQSCNDDNNDGENTPVNDNIKIENFSKESAFVFGMPGFENLNITTLISSSDVLPGSPNFVFGASQTGWES